MNKTETYKIFKTLKSVYHTYFASYTQAEYEELSTVWMKSLGQYPFGQVQEALDKFLSTDTRGFPPTPGSILHLLLIGKKKEPVQTQDPNEEVYRQFAESSKRFWEKTGLDPSLMETDFDLVCRVAYETRITK